MPILKVPVVHKFGIISHSQRIELQERLLRQTYNKEKDAELKEKIKNKQNHLQILEKFVDEYLTCGLEKREVVQEKSHKILLRCKRRAGLSSEGCGTHVNLPLAWSELAIMAQCKGKIREDCLSILNKSLNHAPLSEENIPTLFFLAESTLYWIRTDSQSQPFLRAAEILLLNMGQLVFLRLLYHHFTGNLNGLNDFKERLKTYLEGIDDHQMLYSAYPNLLLALRLISSVGIIIVETSRDISEPDNLLSTPDSPQLPTIIVRALLLWRAATITNTGFKNSLIGMLLMAKDLTSQIWLHSFLTISILGEAARNNLTACQCLQDIARGVVIEPSTHKYHKVVEHKEHFPQHKIPPETATTKASENLHIHGQSDNLSTSDQFQEVVNDMLSDFDNIMNKSKSRQNTTKGLEQARTPMTPLTPAFSIPITPSTAFKEKTIPILINTHLINSLPLTPPLYGIRMWPWETAYQYTQVLLDICLQGSTVPIQKVALMGKWKDADVTTFRTGIPNYCLESCGIVDLLEFQQMPVTSQNNNWSWRVRYGAVSDLVTLTHSIKSGSLRHGMRSAAYSLLNSLKDTPARDDRVMEAIKVCQIKFVEDYVPQDKPEENNIWKRICMGLTEKFFNPVIMKESITPRSQQIAQSQCTGTRPSTTVKKSPQDKPTLKEDLLLHTTVVQSAPSFHSRNEINLNRVVEDQWRKELLIKHAEEEKKKVEDLKLMQQEEERNREEILKRRKKKLNQTNVLPPYQV